MYSATPSCSGADQTRWMYGRFCVIFAPSICMCETMAPRPIDWRLVYERRSALSKIVEPTARRT